MEQLNRTSEMIAKTSRIISRFQNINSSLETNENEEYFDEILFALLQNVFPTLSFIETILNYKSREITKEELKIKILVNWRYLNSHLSENEFIFLSKEAQSTIKKYEDVKKVKSLIKNSISGLDSIEAKTNCLPLPDDLHRLLVKVMSNNYNSVKAANMIINRTDYDMTDDDFEHYLVEKLNQNIIED